MKLSHRGRRSGGVICFIKLNYLPYVRTIEVSCDYILGFVIDKSLFGLEKDVLYICAYMQPEGSPFYLHYNLDNGIGGLEEYLCDCLINRDDVYVILCGDLNSRTANISQELNESNGDSTLFTSSPVPTDRMSEDKALNTYGKLLLNMCSTLNLCILNGMCYGDRQGRYTYFSESGNSVNDYFILSNDLYGRMCESCELSVLERIESSHLPLRLYVDFPRKNSSSSQQDNKTLTSEKIIWNDCFAETYEKSFYSIDTQSRIKVAMNMIDIDVDSALEEFNACLKDASVDMKKRVIGVKKFDGNKWFDNECRTIRKEVRNLLKISRRTLDDDDRDHFCRARREYKKLLKRKKKDYNYGVLTDLLNAIDSQRDFWNKMHKISSNRKQPINNISTEKWFSHFKALLDKDTQSNDEITDQYCGEEDHYLNRPISKEEVQMALRKLKNGKAAGPDGIIGELIKHACKCNLVLDFLVKLFNFLFDRGIFPENWSYSVVLPLYKKGDANDPNNYRGISLCNACSKLYSAIINNRLQTWVKDNNITGEYQAGFKKDYSTIDHMFTLVAFVQKQFSLNRKLYVAFIDFEKAFDSINRCILWRILVKNGVNGKMFRCIKSMYSNVKCKVRSGASLSDCINCTAGVKQGDICSPILFSIYINELTLEICRYGKHGANWYAELLELFILLLADDVMLMSETVVGLQNQLNYLCKVSTELQLKVNMAKSNIIVFRKGGYLAAREHWVCNGVEMPVVNVYKYLGIFFSTKLSFTFACKDLASRAKRALLAVLQKLRQFDNQSFEIFIKLFDSQIQPVVQYAAELWGLDHSVVFCEKVHIYALKRFLGVSMKTPNDLVYGELNRYPIYITSAVECVKYWLKLTRMNDNRLPRKAYKMLVGLDLKGKHNWVTNVKTKLFENGFGHVWVNQGVENINVFVRIFRQRLIDCRWQAWNAHIQGSERFNMYKMFNTLHEIPVYVRFPLCRQFKFIMSKFRFGISDLAVHRFRYNTNVCNYICPLCNEEVETEVHFVLCCPVLSDIRNVFIPLKYYRNPCLFRLILLLSSPSEEVIRKLAVFLYKAFKRRSILTT